MSRFPSKITRTSYQDIVNHVSIQSRVSFRKTGNILTVFSRCVQEHIESGWDVRIDTLCSLQYVSRIAPIHNNSVIDLEGILEHVGQQLEGYSPLDLRTVIFTYVKYIHFLVSTGKQVNLKGICYIRIVECGDDCLKFETRISGVLKKPEKAHFYVLNSNGELELTLHTHEDLRIKLLLDESLNIPADVVQPEPLKLKTLNI